jgi:hypothetical protein
MNNAQPTPLEAGQTGEKNTPENAHLRETSPAGELENGHILEVAFTVSTTPTNHPAESPMPSGGAGSF